MTYNILNLTTGLEFLGEVHPDGFSRLQSTHLEGSHWQHFLNSVDANIWFLLSTGVPVCIWDCGSRRTDGVSRVLWQGLPIIKRAAEQAWGLPMTPMYFRKYNANWDLRRRLDLSKVKYFRKFVTTEEVKLYGHGRPSKTDGRG